jgi:hypothetical protein
MAQPPNPFDAVNRSPFRPLLYTALLPFTLLWVALEYVLMFAIVTDMRLMDRRIQRRRGRRS